MFKVGDKLSIQVKITDDMIRKFADVSGDHNPIHLDEEYAKTTRFKRRVAHGMLSASFISNALATHLGPGGIYLSQTLKFLHPLHIDDTAIIELTVTALRESSGIGTVETLVKNQNGELCVKGEAVVMAAKNVK